MSSPYEGDPSEWGTPAGRAMIELLWNPPMPGTRGPKQRLSLDQIIGAAMEIAAADGVDKLSMRALATKLGVGAMTIYTYVPGRDELFELMIDRAWASRRPADRSLPWRAQIEFHAREAWAMYERYPWMIQSNLWRMPLGPNVLDIQEDLYRAANLTGLPPADVARVTGLVESHVFGIARSKITDTRMSATTGMSADDYWESRSSFWGTYYSAERFPTMTFLWEEKAFDQGMDEGFEFGLARLLDGVELLIARLEL
ncbi:MAG: TetR/AcrR family transcriptional regulator [Nocardiaceae bacterium]|nr:TetR/AcrR family transcriptional regulator [Nocardiaceae bacterium]